MGFPAKVLESEASSATRLKLGELVRSDRPSNTSADIRSVHPVEQSWGIIEDSAELATIQGQGVINYDEEEISLHAILHRLR